MSTLELDELRIVEAPPLQPTGKELFCRTEVVQRTRAPRGDSILLVAALIVGGYTLSRLLRKG